MKDLYGLLDVDKSADDSTLKKAYRKLAVKHHPDKGGDEQKFKDISEAYDILSDPNKRKTYDLGGYEALDGNSGNPFSAFESMFGGSMGSMSGMPGMTGMSGMPGMPDMSDIFGGMGMGGQNNQNMRQQNPVKIHNVEVTLDELQAGYSRQSDYTKKTQEIADERKGLEQYQTQFNEQYQLLTQERQQYQQALSQLGNHLSEGINRFSTVDWAKLKEEDPIAYVTKRDEFREEKERIQQVSNQQNQISQQQATEVEQARRHSVIQESTRLKELIPEWSDPVKQPELAGKIKSYGSSQGYSDQELNNLIDSRSVNVLMKAMKYDALQQADLKTKKIKNKPKMVKPGTKRTKVDAATRRKAKSMKQLQQSGSAVDAGRLLEDIL